MSKNRFYTQREFPDQDQLQANKGHLLGYAFLAFAFLAFHFLLEVELFSALQDYRPFLRKLTLSLSIVMIILLVGKIIENLIYKRETSEGDKHNLLSIVRLVTSILILIVTIAFLFQNLYAMAVSFGLISLVLGFALQAPISSFIAWLYIIFRKPYKVGDRIQLDNLRGDVVEVNYLDTAILECSGDYLQNDRRSGRVIFFPNSVILKSEVINYSGPFLPFIWNETAIQIAYSSDLQFVEACLLKAATIDFQERYQDYGKRNAENWKPTVYFRVNTYAWLEAVVSYPVEPTDTTGRRNRILKIALPALNLEPQKAQFPEGNMR